MEHLRCVVQRITYQNPENGYSVIRCSAKGYSDLVTVVGNMPEVHVGSVLSLDGSWKIDPKYGRQFSMTAFEETLPATVFGIEKYLGSGLIKGIGPKYARKIVQEFGEDTLKVIESDPEALTRIPGIGRRRAGRIQESWQEQKEIRNIMVFLQGHGVSTAHATKIFKTYGNESIPIVQENPYRLADDIWGIGFRTADQIAEKMGFGHERYVRLRSGLLYTLNRLSEEGHCYATRSPLVATAAELLSVGDDTLNMTLDEMIRAGDVITELLPPREDAPDMPAERAIYLTPFFHSERGCARRLCAVAGHAPGVRISLKDLEGRVRRMTGMEYDDVQLEAIRKAVSGKLLILTGGPGTGKTTTTLGIISVFREAGARILLAAPTGRAAKRLQEATGMEAKTIHRLLESKPPSGYQKNEEHPLEGDVLVVDECSMIDIMLMYNLLKAVPDSMTVIFVGDIDQLPSVGPGNVLRDMIDSGCFPVVRLTRIFRQAQKSRIITNAHRINDGRMPDISNDKSSDFFFIDVERRLEKAGAPSDDNTLLAEEAVRIIVELVQRKLPKYFRIPPAEIQVLTPMQKGITGSANLNQELQAALNSAGAAEGRLEQYYHDIKQNRGGEGQGNSVPGPRAADRQGQGNPGGGSAQEPPASGKRAAANGRAQGNSASGPRAADRYAQGNPGGRAPELQRGGYIFRVRDKVMQIRNNYDKEVFNGDIGVITQVNVEEKNLTVRFDDREVAYDISELDELVLSYAATIHKSQGSEYPVVVLPVLMNHYVMLQRNLIYTGITRAKRGLVMVGTRKALSLAIRNVTVTKRNTLLKERIRRNSPGHGTTPGPGTAQGHGTSPELGTSPGQGASPGHGTASQGRGPELS